MDPVTHATAGALAAVTLLPAEDRFKAADLGAAAGVFPDIDLVPLAFMDDLAKILFHRGPTHSLLFVLVCSFVLGAAFSRFYRDRGPSPRAWMAAALLAMMIHIIIDCFTSYGTMIFLPFGSARVAFSIMCPMDPLFTLPAAGLLAFSLLSRNVSVPVRRMAVAGMLFMAAYVAFSAAVRSHVISATRASLAERDIRRVSVTATPTLGGPFLWNVIAVTGDGSFMTGFRSVFDRGGFDLCPLRSNKALLEERDLGVMEVIFDAFTDGYYSVEKYGKGLVVTDLRYGRVPSAGGAPVPVISFRVAGHGGGESIEQIRHGPRRMLEGLAFYFNRLPGK